MSQALIPVSALACDLVWDGTDEVRIPASMGTPRADQMQGSASDRLAELAGRVCYDSLGRGRSSAEFHEHIVDTGHLNVYEHWQKTIHIDIVESALAQRAWLLMLINRPGIWTRVRDDGSIRVTLNERCLKEWEDRRDLAFGGHGEQEYLDTKFSVEPESHEEKWISIFVQGSRAFSHEMVRHRFRTAVSQRSSRYCDESESPWVLHPLAEAWRGNVDVTHIEKDSTIDAARRSYGAATALFQNWLKRRGVDSASARKQARGAARGYLGNALLTEMIFSASVTQWKRMIRMRASDAADAEIRMIFTSKILPVLRSSRYGEDFDEFELAPASDGIGMSLRDGGAK